MKLHVYPVVNLPDFLRRLYANPVGETPDKQPFFSFFRKKKYVPKMPKSLEEVQSEYSYPKTHLPANELQILLDYKLSNLFSFSSKGLYLLYLGTKLPRHDKAFDADRRICTDLVENFMRHECTGIFDGYVLEELFVPECTRNYVSVFDDEDKLPTNVLESNVIGEDGAVLSSVINTLIREARGLGDEAITLGVSPRPFITFDAYKNNEDGSISPAIHSGVSCANNCMISYGFVYNKSLLRHTSILKMPDLEGSLGYAVNLEYSTSIGLLTEFGLHEFYHTLGLGHDTKNKCIMNPVHIGPFDEPILELCDVCKSEALIKASSRADRLKDGKKPVSW